MVLAIFFGFKSLVCSRACYEFYSKAGFRQNWTFLLVLILTSISTGCNKMQYVQRADSMMPTINSGDSVVIKKHNYLGKIPKRWDVIAFTAPPPYEGIWIFRVVGLPGETVSFDESSLLINGKPPNKPANLNMIQYRAFKGDSQREIPSVVKVPPDSIYVLGDSPANSNDSRLWGPLPTSRIIGNIDEK